MKLWTIEARTYRLSLSQMQHVEQLAALAAVIERGWRIEGVMTGSDSSATFVLRRKRWFWQKERA